MKRDANSKETGAPRDEYLPEELQEASRASPKFHLLVAFSCLIATFGLIADSPSVVIGAMLVAPLMTPIQGFALGSVRGRRQLLLPAASALAQGFSVALALSAATAALAIALPIDALSSLTPEATQRTNPNPIDLAVALAGGAVSAYGIARMPDSQALPGVAISTALMPPLCTVGIGIAMGNEQTFRGAGIFFLTNLSAVVFAGVAVFIMLGFRPESKQLAMPSLVTLALGGLVVVTLAAMTLRVVSEGHQSDRVRSAILDAIEAQRPGSVLLEMDHVDDGDTLRLRVTVRTDPGITDEEIAGIHAAISQRLQRPVLLSFSAVPLFVVEAQEPLPPGSSPTPIPTPVPVR